MPSLRTEVTEIVTGLGMLGADDLDDAFRACPGELINVDGAAWARLRDGWNAGELRYDFYGAFTSGRAFLRSSDGLRGRRPERVEWKGTQRVARLDPVPVDLRVDRVFLVSCKYLSSILLNASPSAVFGGDDEPDWYVEVSPEAYQRFYESVRRSIGVNGMPPYVGDLTPDQRLELSRHVPSRLSGEMGETYRQLALDVGRASAARWRASLGSKRAREAALWQLLRISATPYFVLGATRGNVLRLRIDTAWDWRQRYDLRGFEIWGEDAGQPIVRWRAVVRDRERDEDLPVDGHVQVRWSHGKFRQPPEAKVYLDTPHSAVPGYHALG